MKKTNPLPSCRTIFGDNVRKARRLKNYSQEDLASRANISRTYLCEVEHGDRNISVNNMEALSKALGLSLPDLLDPKLFSITADNGRDSDD